MRRRSRCVGLLGVVEVLGHRDGGEWVQHLVQVHRKKTQKIPELEEPAPFQCHLRDRSWRSWMRHPFVGAQVGADQGLVVDRVVEGPLDGVEIEDDQG